MYYKPTFAPLRVGLNRADVYYKPAIAPLRAPAGGRRLPMALEIRGDKKYYYRSRRIEGRVVKEYVGTDPEAEETNWEKAEFRKQCAEMKRIGVILDALQIVIQVLYEDAMTAAGYHKPNRGPWRKRRVPKSPDAPSHSDA
jgi:hypothetical protein